MKTMFMGFNVGGFLSFGEVQRFTMTSTSEENLPNHVTDRHGIRILRGSFIYGPNSAGKSNFVKAVRYSRDVVVKGLDKCEKGPFTHKDDHGNESDSPSYFEYILELDGDIYSYGFEIDTRTKVLVSEWLYEVHAGDDDVALFSVTVDGATESSMKYTGDLYSIYRGNGCREVFLKTLSESEGPLQGLSRKVLGWFAHDLIVQRSEGETQVLILRDRYLDDLTFYLGRLDTGISGYDLEPLDSHMTEGEFFANRKRGRKGDNTIFLLPDEVDGMTVNRLSDRMYPDMDARFDTDVVESCERLAIEGLECLLLSNDTMLYVTGNHGEAVFNRVCFLHGPSRFKVDFHEESQGTKRIAEILCNFDMMEDVTAGSDTKDTPEGKTIVVDELECSVHTLATIELIRIFYDRPGSKTQQLVATTHETRIPRPDVARRDETWFVDRTTEGSRMYSLAEFDDVDEHSTDLAYLEGRYGAVPNLMDPHGGDL